MVSKKVGTEVKLSENEIIYLIKQTTKIFSEQEILLDLEAPIAILGKEPLYNLKVIYMGNILIY